LANEAQVVGEGDTASGSPYVQAVLQDSPILILDEATSSVGTEAEQLIQQAPERLMVGRTIVVIPHRLLTIYEANHVVVLQDGRIAGQGTHAELMTRDGLYRCIQPGSDCRGTVGEGGSRSRGDAAAYSGRRQPSMILYATGRLRR
jgi:ABC-type sugar transport system ATPase subunit